MQCDHCSSATARLKCGKCNLFAYCSNECVDAHALEHARVCYDTSSRDHAYLQKHLAKALVYADEELHPEIYDLMDKMHVERAHNVLIEAKGRFSGFSKNKIKTPKTPKKKRFSFGRGRSKTRDKPKKTLSQRFKDAKAARKLRRSSSSEKSKSASPTKRSFWKRSSSSRSNSPSSDSASPSKRSLFQRGKDYIKKKKRSMSRSRSRSNSPSSYSSSGGSSPSRSPSFTQRLKDKALRARDKARELEAKWKNYRSRSTSPVSPRNTVVVPQPQPQQVVMYPQQVPKRVEPIPREQQSSQDDNVPQQQQPTNNVIEFWY